MASGHRTVLTPAQTVVEREQELRAIDEALEAARTGQGAALLIEGAPGHGKSMLLAYAREQALAHDMNVLSAHGGELETTFPFGVVRQLFESKLAELEPEVRDRLLTGAAGLAAPVLHERRRRPRPGSEVPESGGIHGIYTLAVRIAEERPVVVCVDDLHWADEASLRWLSYLARRVAGRPLALIAAARHVRGSGSAGTGELLRALEHAPALERHVLRRLSRHGTAELIAAALHDEPDPELVDACQAATAGSPLLLVELLRSLSAEGLEPNAESVERVFAAGPASISRAALARLRGLPAGTPEFAQALAVLERATLTTTARLAGLDPDAAKLIASGLIEVGVVADNLPLEFTHALIRTAAYAELSAVARVQLHGQAARLLAAEGAEPERIARHLLEAEPGHETWALDTLMTAAGNVSQRGAPEIAVRFLRRALTEFPVGQRPASVLAALGRAEVQVGDARAGAEHLRAALEATDPEATDERQELAAELGRSLMSAGVIQEATRVLSQTIEHLPADQSEAGLRLEAAVNLAAARDLRAKRLRDSAHTRFQPDRGAAGGQLTLGERMAMAVEAFRSAQVGSPELAVELAERAIEGGALLREVAADDPVLCAAPAALLYAGHLGHALGLLSTVLERVSAEGSRRGLMFASAWRGLASLRMGRLADAELDARAALELAAALKQPSKTALAVLIETLVERGRLEEADALVPGDLEAATLGNVHLAQATGRLRFTQERLDDAVAAFARAGELCAKLEITGPDVVAWGPWRARALAAHAKSEQLGHEVAREAVAQARDGASPLGLGITLRCVAGAELDPLRRAQILSEAVELLRGSRAELELAKALASLGVELRRRGKRVDARAPLREALELAQACGAEPLSARIRDDLVVLGARPRRAEESRDELTAAERRVARLAARGRTNRQIAEDLHITAKTAEYHLTSIYRKLEISSREDLASALEAYEVSS